MLQPANRSTLIDAMRPPAGFTFESAMAVTYTLDLRALLAAPAALAFAGHGDADGTDGDALEPIELIHALRSHAGKLTVLSQVGEIALPPSRRVFAFLERAIVPVAARRGGIVHPKVWVLRYEAGSDPTDDHPRERRLRVLVPSRNLTFDESWDTMVRLDETADPGGVLLDPVGDLFGGLLRNSGGRASEDHRARVRSLSAALQEARFALPPGIDDLKVHVLGLDDARSPLPTTTERSLIISPFVSDDFFTRVHDVRIDELVGRPEWLDRLEPDSLSKVGTVHAFDDGGAPDLGIEDGRVSPFDPGRPLVGLHAKVFAFEEAGRARLFLGSANATGPAFANNVEILVELVGSTAALGIDRLCDGADGEPGLRDLFYDYRRSCPDDGTDGESSLDDWRHAIARLPIDGHVEESGAGWAVTYRTTRPMPAPDDVEIWCWPLSTAGNRRQVTKGEPLGERFETSLENLSGFLAFELAAEDGALSSFVVPVRLIDVPEQRERLLLQVLIGNAERFFRYLMALLDEETGETSLVNVVERLGNETPEGGPNPLSLPVLEKLLRTMRRDPARLVGLHPLVSDLAADDALPEGFTELWTMILDVAETGVEAR